MILLFIPIGSYGLILIFVGAFERCFDKKSGNSAIVLGIILTLISIGGFAYAFLQ